MSRKKCLEAEINKAIQEKSTFAVSIQIPDCPKPEIIINPWDNLEYKLEYYKKAYNDDLELINNTKIKIVDFGIPYNTK